jgi:hypothetical protein
MTVIGGSADPDPLDEIIPEPDPLDRLLRGAKAIGKAAGYETLRQAYHALENGYVDADKRGGMWISTTRRARRHSEFKQDWQPRKPNNPPKDAA